MSNPFDSDAGTNPFGTSFKAPEVKFATNNPFDNPRGSLAIVPNNRRYTVTAARGGRVSVKAFAVQPALLPEVVAEPPPLIDDNAIDEVLVPHEIIDALANNMPRLLQLIATWSGRTGEVDEEAFEKVLHTLGVRYTPEQVLMLFRILDMDANGRVGLGELLMLKNAIDNGITALPARPSMGDDEEDPMSSREIVLKIDHYEAVQVPKTRTGLLGALRGVLGAVWKSDLRPHHALDAMTTPWQARGPAKVHARMRVEAHAGPSSGRVRLELFARRGPPPAMRARFVYEAGPVGDLGAFCDDCQAGAAAAAEQCCAELDSLLSETRQIDLKLAEVRLMKGRESRETEAKLMRLKHLMREMAADVEECLIMQTRYTRPDFKQPSGLVGVPRVVRVTEELLPVDDHKTATRLVSKVALTLLFATALFWFFIYIGLAATRYWENQRVCEFLHFACDSTMKREWQYECNRDEGSIALRPTDNPDLPRPYAFGEGVLERSCDFELQHASWWFFLPLPGLILSAVVLPLGLFRNNAHPTTIKKLLLWTPSVPLIILQCFFRACILLSTIHDAADKAYASINAIEALILVPQVGIFLLMDSLRHPTPQLRLWYAVFLMGRFFISVVSRATVIYPAEQHPLIPEQNRGIFMGSGATTKQSTLASIDWTITLMLFSSILSVINYPGEMAVVRLRCDTKAYFNWRDQYIGAMNVRSHRRDLDAADSYLWWRSKADRCKEKVQRMLPGKRVAAPARGNAKIPTEATPVMEGVTLSAD